jgi:hypothetical protein
LKYDFFIGYSRGIILKYIEQTNKVEEIYIWESRNKGARPQQEKTTKIKGKGSLKILFLFELILYA